MIKGKIERRIYIEKKQEYARPCSNKQEEEKKKEQKKLLEIKNRNEVLKYIKRERQQKEFTDDDIKEKDWVNHFRKLLDGVDIRTETTSSLEEEDKRKELIGEEIIITQEELESVIARLKKKEAPGEDIRNEV